MSSPTAPYTQLSFVYFCEGHPCVNIFRYTAMPDDPTSTGAHDMAMTFLTTMQPLYQAVLGGDVLISGVSCVINTGTDSFTGDAEPADGTFGLSGDHSLPPQDVAACVRHLGGFGDVGRITRGHFYVSGLDEERVDGGRIGDTMIADLQAIGDAAKDLNGGEKVWSRKTNSWHPVTAYSVTSQVRVLRRRRTSS